jgi:UDPglucose 6-dehydrogenase
MNEITKSKTRIAIIGAGVVGSATGTVLSQQGFPITFVDNNPEIVDSLREKGFSAIDPSDFPGNDHEVCFICVPTYRGTYSDGLKHIKDVAVMLGRWIGQATGYKLIVLRSTVIPGTAEDLVLPIIESISRKKAGVDFGICFNPEYLREKSAVDDFRTPRLVVIGESNRRDGDILADIYYWTVCPVYRISIKEAEMQKFIHNVFNAVKISYFNEMRMVCRQIGIKEDDIFSITMKSAEAAWNPNYGLADLGPFGGTCLPKDSRALFEFAKTALNRRLQMVGAAIDVNEQIADNLAASKQAEIQVRI